MLDIYKTKYIKIKTESNKKHLFNISGLCIIQSSLKPPEIYFVQVYYEVFFSWKSLFEKSYFQRPTFYSEKISHN